MECTGTLYAVACGQVYAGRSTGSCTFAMNTNVTTVVSIEGTCVGCTVDIDVVPGAVSA